MTLYDSFFSSSFQNFHLIALISLIGDTHSKMLCDFDFRSFRTQRRMTSPLVEDRDERRSKRTNSSGLNSTSFVDFFLKQDYFMSVKDNYLF